MNTETKDPEGNNLFTDDMHERDIEKYEYPYKFSIIMSVYNVEEYFPAAIESIFNQNIGFVESVQIILVDDGSTDQSGMMCDEYAKQYPDNIIVIHKDNCGLSSARNEGLKYVTGEYFIFFDSDDKLSLGTLKVVYKFFKKHHEETDIVTIPIYFFEGTSGHHWLNWKFNRGSRVIDLLREPLNPCMTIAASFFKNERKDDLIFDIDLPIAEDMKSILDHLYPKLTLGVVSNAKYFYRIRTDGSSTMQTTKTKKEWYLNYAPLLLQWAFDFYRERLGQIPGFVQYILLCDYQGRILDKVDPLQTLSEEEVREYKEHLYSSLKFFDDKYILELKKLSKEHKLFLLSKKYDSKLKEIHRTNNRYYLHTGNVAMFFESMSLCKIDFLSLDNGKFSIEGWTRIFGFEKSDDIKVFLEVNDEFILCDKTEKDRNIYLFGELMSPGVGFKSAINLDADVKKYQIKIYIEINGRKIIKKNIKFSRFCPLTHSPKNMYFYDQGRALTYSNGSFSIAACSRLNWFHREGRLLLELLRTKDGGARRAVWRRILCHVSSLVQKKKRWIITDRVDKAGDNGEALFRYLSKVKDNDIDYCFAIEKNSPDYKRLKEFGKVIPFRGWQHKLYCVQGANMVSSHAYPPCKYPMLSDTQYYQDLFSKARFIFLQHGTTLHDVSRALQRYNINFSLFITSTAPEYKSIMEYDYFYTEKQVKLTGFPRHDLLVHDGKKHITIMPTWRSYLVTQFNEVTGKRKLSNDFQNSTFYKFYSSLLTHTQLLAAVSEYGYTLCYMPHPELNTPSTNVIEVAPQVKVFGATTLYRTVFAESNMIVTDYSSVAFDFAYLRKPVLYCHFDAADFFGKHGYAEGYFDYERDGFGEVVYDLDATVEHIIEYMKNGCKLKDKYRQRIENTFAFNDQNNCERVSQAIKGLDHE